MLDSGAASSLPPVPPFSTVYQQYFGFVWASARRLGVAPEAIDDVVQDVFIVIHNRMATVEKPEALRSWIYGVVRRTVSDHHRARRTKAASGENLVAIGASHGPDQPTPFDLKEQSERWALLSSLLDELDEAKREVFVLAELHELRAPEIAEMLEIPLNTVYSRLRAARILFEEALARRAPEGRET